MTMLKTITAVKARQNLGQLMNEVVIREDDYIIERSGKQLVAIIPIEKYRRFEQEEDRARNEFSQWVDKIRERTKNVDQKLLEETIQEAVEAVKLKENKAYQQDV